MLRKSLADFSANSSAEFPVNFRPCLFREFSALFLQAFRSLLSRKSLAKFMPKNVSIPRFLKALFPALWLWGGGETHKQNPPKMPGRSRENVICVFLCYFFVCSSCFKLLAISDGRLSSSRSFTKTSKPNERRRQWSDQELYAFYSHSNHLAPSADATTAAITTVHVKALGTETQSLARPKIFPIHTVA